MRWIDNFRSEFCFLARSLYTLSLSIYKNEKINITPLSTFQLLRCTLTISLYAFSPPLPTPFRDVTRPRVLLQRYPMRRPKVDGLFPRKETGHLLFPYSDMKRHFYFCRPPRTAVSSLFLPSSKLSRGNINATFVSAVRGVRGELTIWISYLQRISSLPSPFSATPSFSRPNFSYSSSNRPARDSASYTQSSSKALAPLSVCFCEFPCDAILICLSPPCFRVLSPARRMQPRRVRDDFQL